MAADGAPTRDRIIEQALELYVEAGMNGFSMRKLAERVDLSATAIYRHFEGKEAVLIAVLEAGYARFATYLMRGLSGSSAVERLTRSGHGYVSFALEHPAYYRIMFLSSRDDFGFAELPRRSVDQQQRAFQLLIDRVRECQDEGAIRAGDPADVAVLVWSLSHGLVSLYLTGQLRSRFATEADFVAGFQRARAELIAALRP